MLSIFSSSNLDFLFLENPAPTPNTSEKKAKSASSAEEEDKDVFVLRVSRDIRPYNAGELYKILPCFLINLLRFLLQVRGRERYEWLKKIHDGLELLDRER